jgi:hypothetical protein
MSTTTEPTTTLGRWPDSCGDPSCKSHLARKSNRCRCPRYKAPGPGYHITNRNLDCPVHKAVDVTGPDGLAEWIDREAATADRPNGSAGNPHLSPRARRAGGGGATGPSTEPARGGPPAKGRHAGAGGGPVAVDQVCHRQIDGTDTLDGALFRPCPDCGHLLAVHVGTDGCPVCRVEMMAKILGWMFMRPGRR